MPADHLGKYRLVQHLASGGMASVYLARLSGLGGFERHVVLKTLRAEGLDDDTLVPMFLDEARLVAMLHHPHIAQVYEVGRDDTTYFLAMEYVHGETVRSVLETADRCRRTLPLAFSLTVGCAAAAGLHHAHERCGLDGSPLGIVHRDVTPSNVIVSYDGAIKLIDFGIAKATARSTVTRTGLIKGKVGYMAPEQVRGYAVDRRSDVFALGVLIYELTTQSRAFDAATQFEQLERSAHSDLVPPSRIVDGYPRALEDVVMTALELDPDDRYPTADAMRLALVRVGAELGLALGDAAIVHVLGDLFGRRPEPWLLGPVARAAVPPPSLETPPFRERHPLVPDPAGFARGSGDHDAIDDAEDDDATTDPIELPTSELVTSEVLELEPERSRRAVTVPLPRSVLAAAARVAALPLPPPVTLPAPPRASPRAPALPMPPSATAEHAAARSQWRGTIIGGSLLLALACAVTIVVTLAYEAQQPAPSPVIVPPPETRGSPPVAHEPPPPPPPAPARAPVPDRVTLHVITEPPGATVVLDGVRLGTSPYLGEVSIKSGRAWLKVRKSRHNAVKIPVSLERDVTWNVRLRPRR